jgi:hypothetical protein
MRQQQEFLNWTAAVQQFPAVEGIYLISGQSGFWGAAFFSTELQTWQNFIGHCLVESRRDINSSRHALTRGPSAILTLGIGAKRSAAFHTKWY